MAPLNVPDPPAGLRVVVLRADEAESGDPVVAVQEFLGARPAFGMGRHVVFEEHEALAKVVSPLEQPGPSLSSLVEAEAAAEMEAVAEDLGRITTAAGPAQALRSLAPTDRPGPEEAWQAAPQRQVTARTSYRAKLVEATPPPEPTSGSAPDARTRILARIVKVGTPEGVGYVVIGSYGTRDSADVEAQTFSQWHPKIMTAEVKGKTYFRVAVGPFARTDLSAALKAIVADGAKNAWPLVTKPRSQAAAPDKS